MTKDIEQLLRPRVKVIALWPFCRQHNNMDDQPKVGEIFHVSEGGHITNNAMTIMSVHKYPHLFDPLPWWSDRKPDEMPEYVKGKTDEVWKVKEWRKIKGGWSYDLWRNGYAIESWLQVEDVDFNGLSICTEADYINYNQSQPTS